MFDMLPPSPCPSSDSCVGLPRIEATMVFFDGCVRLIPKSGRQWRVLGKTGYELLLWWRLDAMRRCVVWRVRRVVVVVSGHGYVVGLDRTDRN